jgi:hypothetical protein
MAPFHPTPGPLQPPSSSPPPTLPCLLLPPPSHPSHLLSGCCWAFTAVSLVESSYLLSGRGDRNTLDLSEQQVTSCCNPSNSPYNGYGCNGGWIDSVRAAAECFAALPPSPPLFLSRSLGPDITSARVEKRKAIASAAGAKLGFLSLLSDTLPISPCRLSHSCCLTPAGHQLRRLDVSPEGGA